MNIDDLKKGLSGLKKIYSAGIIKDYAILNNVLIQDDKLIASNLDDTVIYQLSEPTGVHVLIDYKKLSKVISKIKADYVRFSGEKNRLYITYKGRSGETTITLPTGNLIRYPEIPELDDKLEIINIPSDVLVRALSFSSKLEERYFMQGVHIDNYAVAATNGKWMYYNTQYVSRGAVDLTPGTISILASLKEKYTLIYVYEKYFMLSAGNFSIIQRRDAIQFPAYRRVIPTDNNTTIQFEKTELLEKLDIASALLDVPTKVSDSPQDRIEFHLGKERGAIKVSGDNGDQTISINRVMINQPKINFAISLAYLKHVTQCIDASTITVETQIEDTICERAFVFENKQEHYIVMPMRYNQ